MWNHLLLVLTLTLTSLNLGVYISEKVPTPNLFLQNFLKLLSFSFFKLY